MRETHRDNNLVIRFSVLILLMSAVFLVLKTYRGFSGSTTEGGVWNYIQLAFVGLGVIYFFRYSKWIINCRPIRALLWLSMLMFFSTALSLQSLSISSIYNLAMTIYAFNVLIIFYQIGRTTDISKKNILMPVYFIIALIVILAIVEWIGSSRVWTQRGAVSDVYYVIGLLPLMLIFFDEKRVLIPIITAAVAISFSGKRAGMIAVVLMIIAYYLIQGSQKDSLKQQSRTLLKMLIVMTIIIASGIYLDNRLGLRIVERLLRLSTDGGSGRDTRWELIWNAIKASSTLQYLIGHGGGTIKANLGGHAHNDFIELFYEQGLVGAFLYALFFVRLILINIKMIKAKYKYASQFSMSLICSLVLAIFSFYIVDPTYITCGMICIGLILGDYESKKNVR